MTARSPRHSWHQVQIFQYTGIQQQFQVPSGVTSLDMVPLVPAQSLVSNREILVEFKSIT